VFGFHCLKKGQKMGGNAMKSKMVVLLVMLSFFLFITSCGQKNESETGMKAPAEQSQQEMTQTTAPAEPEMNQEEQGMPGEEGTMETTTTEESAAPSENSEDME